MIQLIIKPAGRFVMYTYSNRGCMKNKTPFFALLITSVVLIFVVIYYIASSVP
jgi:hypothetical protein